ncbi:MAG: choice-of-anchor L domain-containing protein [Bacteroidetes bacterium]|nr:choice-of-anchor L domain-containing protein [Bacteroidota bacterium]
MTPLQLVQTQLVGQGITILNATFNGSSATISSNLIGYFSATGGAQTELGLGGGLILTSGYANKAIGPNDVCGAGYGWHITGDPDLTIIAGVNTWDACVLEFDFIPEADTISFRYVFGSEEFFFWCYDYNDPFGFFLSGPGINGTFSNNSIDIAIMGGSTDYINIDNICSDPSVAWCNSPVDCPPKNGVTVPSYANCSTSLGQGQYLQYNAFCYTMTAKHDVIPGQVYHIKLAVADALDWVLDSGVFLEKNSFSSNVNLTVTNTYTKPELALGSIEGCSDAIVSFLLATPAPQNCTIHYTIGGTAIMGTDYTPLPDSIVIPQGQDSAALVIHALPDGIPEGMESVILAISYQSGQGLTNLTDSVHIIDLSPVQVSTGNDITTCPGTTVPLHANQSGGIGPYQYLWKNGSTLPDTNITASMGTQQYWVSITDGCNQVESDTIMVSGYPPVHVFAGNDTTVCAGIQVTLNAVKSSGIAPYQYLWSTGSTQQSITVTPPPGINHFWVRITDGCGSVASDTVTVTVDPGPVITNIKRIDTICSNGTTNILFTSNTTGTTYTWTATGSSPTVTGYSNGSGPGIVQTLVNTGVIVDTVKYHVTPQRNQCLGTPVNFKVLVYPVANVNFFPASQIFCSGSQTAINLTSNVAGVTFAWTATASSGYVSGYSPGNGNYIQQTLNTSGYDLDSVTYTVTPSFRNCTGTLGGVTVKIKPVPVVTLISCEDIITSINAKPFRLRGGSPLNGTWSGPGVNSTTGMFRPNVAGFGAKVIHYTYTNFFGCTRSSTKTITITPLPVFTCGQLFTDIRDNRQYPTVQINLQCWLSANLNYGTMIPAAISQRDNCIAEKYCLNDLTGNCQLGTASYQWDELIQYGETNSIQGLCPPGWHLPSETEWNNLFAVYTNNGFAGSPLKYTGYSGFDAFLHGSSHENRTWDWLNFATFFWSSTAVDANRAWAHGMNEPDPSVSLYPALRSNAFSVRCIKD